MIPSMRYNIPPSLERRAVPRKKTFLERLDRETVLLAALGGSVSLVAWLAVGALTGLGKLASLLVPLAAAVVIVGALLALTRLAWLVWTGAAVAVALFCVAAMTPFVTSVLQPKALVRVDPIPKEPLDAVIVLSESITPDSLLMPQALDRLLTGLALMRDSVANILVVTEPRRRDNGATTRTDQARVRALVPRSFPTFIVDSVGTTRDEAVGSWRLLQPRQARRVAVVTSPLHTRRACATFEQVGFSVTCVPAVSRAYTVTQPRTAQDRLALFRAWLYERAASVEYRRRGWLSKR